jgi:hypothetical protein
VNDPNSAHVWRSCDRSNAVAWRCCHRHVHIHEVCRLIKRGDVTRGTTTGSDRLNVELHDSAHRLHVLRVRRDGVTPGSCQRRLNLEQLSRPVQFSVAVDSSHFQRRAFCHSARLRFSRSMDGCVIAGPGGGLRYLCHSCLLQGSRERHSEPRSLAAAREWNTSLFHRQTCRS